MADGAAAAAAPASDEGPGQETVGKAVRKKFGKEFFSGTVIEFDASEKWYKVKYEDDDMEDVDWAELSKLIAAAEKTPKTPKTPAAKRKAAPATAVAKKAKVEAPAPATVGGKRVASGGPGQGRSAAKRVSVATPKVREAAAAAVTKKPVGRPKKAAKENKPKAAVPAGQGRAAIGRKIRKRFEDVGAYYSGTVTNFDPQVQYYKVVYTDDDAEEMEWDELSQWFVDETTENGTAEAGTSAQPATPAVASSPAKATRKATAATPQKEPAGVINLE